MPLKRHRRRRQRQKKKSLPPKSNHRTVDRPSNTIRNRTAASWSDMCLIWQVDFRIMHSAAPGWWNWYWQWHVDITGLGGCARVFVFCWSNPINWNSLRWWVECLYRFSAIRTILFAARTDGLCATMYSFCVRVCLLFLLLLSGAPCFFLLCRCYCCSMFFMCVAQQGRIVRRSHTDRPYLLFFLFAHFMIIVGSHYLCAAYGRE